MADLSLEIKPVVRILRELAEEQPDAAAITCGDQTITRRAGGESNRLARAYAGLGAGFGDFVTLGLPNSIEFYVAMLATWKVGAVPQPVSYRLPAAERKAIIDLADSKLVVGVPEGEHPGRTCVPAGYRPDPALDESPLPEVVSALRAPTSGGSTGRPKLIVTDAGGGPRRRPASSSRCSPTTQLVPGPLYHNAPLSLSTAGLLIGHHLIVLPKFDAVAALEAIGRYQVNWMNLVPTMMSRMLRALEAEPGRFDLSSLRVVWHMAAPCADWLKQAWIDLVGPEKLMELYGGTEAQSATTISGTDWLTHRGSVGKPIVGEMIVLDAEGKPAPPGQMGEVFMRRAAGTPPTYRYIGAEAREIDGWETLGDLGWMDEDGFLYLSDRRTDLILSGGANVYPAEVEAALDTHPQVLSSVVVGIPDADLGQRVHALVQATGELTEDELRAHLADRLVRYKIPRSFEPSTSRCATMPARRGAPPSRRCRVEAGEHVGRRRRRRLCDREEELLVRIDQFDGRVAFVTGGAQGIGLGIARALAKAGREDRHRRHQRDALAAAEKEFWGVTDVVAAVLDVRHRDAYATLADDVETRLGPVTLLFNNAGVAGSTSPARMSYQSWDWVIGVNLQGVYNGVQTFVPRMIERGGGGYVVNTASGAGLVAEQPASSTRRRSSRSSAYRSRCTSSSPTTTSE